MSHPIIDLKPNPLHTKAMLLFVYMKPVLKELKSAREFTLYDQMSRAVRSVKNCVNEAQSCESRKDFIHKLKMADKELHEVTGMVSTEYEASETLTRHHKLFMEMLADIAKLLGSSIATARKNL